MKAYLFSLLGSVAFTVISTTALAMCEDRVDSVELFHVNGMLTSVSDFGANLQALKQFAAHHLGHLPIAPDVQGHHNKSEAALAQTLEVIRHKLGDWNANKRAAAYQFANGEAGYVQDAERLSAIEELLREVGGAYAGMIDEEDAVASKAALKEHLDSCSRVVMVSHSQGNFYADMLLNWAYQSYQYPNGFRLSKYPMLANIQLASPNYTPGGAVSELYPNLIGHVTLDNDLAMALVRSTVGSVEANFPATLNPNDLTGHSLVRSYLLPPPQASEIARQIVGVVAGMVPYPLHGQRATGSAAFAGAGYSSLSQMMDLWFASGGVYRYSYVEASTFEHFWSASSQGAYFNEHIRPNYAYEKIEDE